MSNTTFEVNDCEGRNLLTIEAGRDPDFPLDLQAIDGGVYV